MCSRSQVLLLVILRLVTTLSTTLMCWRSFIFRGRVYQFTKKISWKADNGNPCFYLWSHNLWFYCGRSKFFTWEGINALSSEDLESLRNRKSYHMDKKIKLIAELNLLQTSDPNVYQYLWKLVILWNRIHIQNENQNLEIDEMDAFTKPRRVKAEKCLNYLWIGS